MLLQSRYTYESFDILELDEKITLQVDSTEIY